MEEQRAFPDDFEMCIRFHGHLCPGLGIGYAAAKAGMQLLGVSGAKDEEVVAVAENDSCAVDAIQVILGCTFGKGNLVFRDWGKQVFTFFDRGRSASVRLSFKQDVLESRKQRCELQNKVASGKATEEEKNLLAELRITAVRELVTGDPTRFFRVSEASMEIPPLAQRVPTVTCAICGEGTMSTRLVEQDGKQICLGCSS
jgi:formylmethanofuran dehydrogenase subunit E